MNHIELARRAAFVWPHGAWFEREAAQQYRLGHYRTITGRNFNDLYLVRFWMSTPFEDEECTESPKAWESGDSVLLHYFLRPDDDGALHDHPWDFRTTILQGGYTEALPAPDWSPACGGPDEGRKVFHNEGQTVSHLAEDLHRVSSAEPETWTMVRTGFRQREWGFHPRGEPWQPWREYLAAKAARA